MKFEENDLVLIDTSKRGGSTMKIHGKQGVVMASLTRGTRKDLYAVEVEGAQYALFEDELTKLPGELAKLGEKAFDELGLIWDELGTNERAVLLTLAHRLHAGQLRYGKLEPNKKDWKKEAYEEALDMSVYAACLFLQESPND